MFGTDWGEMGGGGRDSTGSLKLLLETCLLSILI